MKIFPDKIDGQWVVKKNYICLNLSRGSYFGRNNTTNIYLNALDHLFNDHGTDVGWVKQELLNSRSSGVRGELVVVSIKDNKVILQPTDVLYDEPDEYAVEIDRAVLLRLTNDWEVLVKAKAPEIFIYEKDGEIFVSDTLPEGMEY